MGCDYFADKDGNFRLEVKTRESRERREIYITGLEPGEEIDRELLLGRDR